MMKRLGDEIASDRPNGSCIPHLDVGIPSTALLGKVTRSRSVGQDGYLNPIDESGEAEGRPRSGYRNIAGPCHNRNLLASEPLRKNRNAPTAPGVRPPAPEPNLSRSASGRCGCGCGRL